MYHGKNLPTGPRGDVVLQGIRRIGWQSGNPRTGEAWVALVDVRHGRYYVRDCKAQLIVHG